jgi:ADP-heptose:LPS heptosyltransferase
MILTLSPLLRAGAGATTLGPGPAAAANTNRSAEGEVPESPGSAHQERRSTRVPNAGRSSLDRIIIYRLGSLGDTVAALPCFHLIERSYPNAERVVLTNFPPSSKATPLEVILKPGAFIHSSIPYPLGLRSPKQIVELAKLVRGRQAHTLIYLAASRRVAAAWRDVAFFRMCGFDQIIGAPLSKDLQANRTDYAGNLEHESHRLARTLRALGEIDLEDRAWWDLRLTAQEHAAAQNQLGKMCE